MMRNVYTLDFFKTMIMCKHVQAESLVSHIIVL